MDDWNHEANIHNIPDYPDDWPSEQRVGAYWYALQHIGFPGNTQGWHAVWKQVEREQARRTNR